MTDEPIVLDDKAREAVHAARDAAFAIEVTRQAQAADAAHQAAERAAVVAAERILSDKRFGEIVEEKMRHVLTQGTREQREAIVARIPYVCEDIRGIKIILQQVQENMTYMPLVQKLVFGLTSIVLVSVIGVLGSVIVMVLSKGNMVH